MNRTWRILAKALGEKSGKNDSEADIIALVRLGMFLSVLITNMCIIANFIRHYNDAEKPQIIEIHLIYDEVQGDLQPKEKEGNLSPGSGLL